MNGAMMKFRKPSETMMPRRLKVAALLAVIGIALSGCVVYPSSYGYGYGGYAAPAYYAPPVVVGVGGGWGWGGGWGRGGWR
jgi:hypothetical protein